MTKSAHDSAPSEVAANSARSEAETAPESNSATPEPGQTMDRSEDIARCVAAIRERYLSPDSCAPRRCAEDILTLLGIIYTMNAAIAEVTIGCTCPAALVARDVELAAREPGQAMDDIPLPEDDAIKAAHPLQPGRHDLYAEAMRLVGARHSKAGLVELVTWLLVDREAARYIAEHGECTCSRPNISEPCDLHEPPWRPRGPVAADKPWHPCPHGNHGTCQQCEWAAGPKCDKCGHPARLHCSPSWGSMCAQCDCGDEP
jgi:hypothetical protein